MKHLKPFNEAVTQDNIELCCVDLFDDGFNLEGFTKTGDTIILLRKTIISDMPEWNGEGTDVRGEVIWNEHLSKYQPCNITIKGNNFEQVTVDSRAKCGWDRNKQLPFTDEENKLISQVTDSANILSHYSETGKHFFTFSRNRIIEIKISSNPRQNPMNFQYDKYVTNIDIRFLL